MTSSGLFLFDCTQRPRTKEIKAPKTPTTKKPRMIKPAGMREFVPATGSNVGYCSGGGAVNVGRRVGVNWLPKAAA
jgi:hypothetical protein